MSAEHVGWAFRQECGSPTRKLVLVALADRLNKDTLQCNPRVETLALDCDLNERSVRRALKELCDEGVISRSRRRRKDGSLSGYEYAFPDVRFVSSPPDTESASEGVLPDTASGRPPDSLPAPIENREVLNREGTTGTELPTAAVASVAGNGSVFDPLKGKKIDGRLVPWDALVGETEEHGDANAARVGKALKSIRKDVWAVAEAHGMTIESVQGRWQEYEQALAVEITRRVRWLKREKPELTWGADGVSRWWSRVPVGGEESRMARLEMLVEEGRRRAEGRTT